MKPVIRQRKYSSPNQLHPNGEFPASALFSLYHVWQYVLVYQEPKLLLSALAYVPVSAALTFCYEQTRSIWPPVFFHMCINALSLTVLAG